MHTFWRALQLIISLAVIAGAVWLFFNYQTVIDRYQLWQYEPSPEIAALAERTTMTDDGRFYFYVTHPELVGRDQFQHHCGGQDEGNVLGCYTGLNIYVYDVDDERLDGIREVTAAHEMLHAAYDRLSNDERERIDTLLTDDLARLEDDTLRERLSVYDGLSSADQTNELHSILGTEIVDLNPELEDYYAQYFDDRSRVVALFQQYESVFRELRDQQETLLAELEQLASDINQRVAAYNDSIAQLNADIQAFNQRASSGGFSSEAAFEAERERLIAQQNSLDAEHAAINNLIAEFEQKQTDLDLLNVEAESLQQSIDSSPQPVPSI